MSFKVLSAAFLGLALASCEKEKPAAEAPAPVAGEKIVVPVVATPPVVETPAVTPPEEEIGVEEPMVPESEVVIGEEGATPGQKLDNAIQQTGQGLQRLGEKIERKANEAGR